MLCILQARMSSKRLPGKSLKKIGKKIMLERVINRISQSNYVSKIIIATSNKKSDFPIRKFCKLRKIRCYCGQLNNVAQRFYKILQKNNVKSFIRISGDSPFIDPRLIDFAIKKFANSKFDIVTNIFPKSFPKGQSVEIIRTSTFKNEYFQMKKKLHLEHVTRFFYDNFKKFKIKNFSNKKNISHLNMSVDSKKDLKWAQNLCNHTSESEMLYLNWKQILQKSYEKK